MSSPPLRSACRVLLAGFVLALASSITHARHVGAKHNDNVRTAVNPVSRTAFAPDVMGVFDLEVVSDGAYDCPSSIEHTTWIYDQPPANPISMEHHTILQDGQRCEGIQGGKKLVLYQSDFYSSDFMALSDTEPAIPEPLIMFMNSSGYNQAILSNLNSQLVESTGKPENYFFGYEKDLRECGGKSVFRDGTTVFVVRPYKDFTIFKLDGLTFAEGKRYLIMVPKYKSVVCVYSNYLRTPSPTPMVTPDMMMMPSPDMMPAEVVEPTVSQAPVPVIDTPVQADVSMAPEDEEPDDHEHEDGDDHGDGDGDGDDHHGAEMMPSYMPEHSPDHEDKDDEEHSDNDGHDHGHEDGDKPHSTPDSDSTMAGFSPEPAEDEICFPASATVTLVDGTIKSMADLASGDIVFGKHGTPTRVFGFSHSDATLLSKFIALKTHSGHTLRTTPGHFVYANEAVVAAKDVRVGDMLTLGDGQTSGVSQIEEYVARGVYNPQTEEGDIVVDGVLATTFTKDVDPTFAHAAMMPLRALYRFTGLDVLQSLLDNGARSLIALVPKA